MPLPHTSRSTIRRAVVARRRVAVVAHLAGVTDGVAAARDLAVEPALVRQVRIHRPGVAGLAGDRVDDHVTARRTLAVGPAHRVRQVRVHHQTEVALLVDGVDDPVAADLERLAVRRAAIAADDVAVITHLAARGIEDAITAGLGRLAVRGATIATSDIAVVAHLALDDIDGRVATGLVGLAVTRAAVAAGDVVVVAHLAGIANAITATRALTVGPTRRIGSTGVRAP